jgi:DNA-binding transcriptional regulator YiaG
MHMNKPVPNLRLRAARMAMRLSQSEFATAVRHAGASLGEPNECTKRLVQKWESGEHSAIRPNYRRALQAVTRIPYEQLGFLGANSAPTVPMAQALETAAAVIPRSPAARGLPQSGVEGDRLRYALTRPGYADEDSVALIEAHTTHLFEVEHTRAARLLAPQVAAHLDDVASVLAGARRSVLRQKLAATGGRSAALAGWLAFDCGDVQGAHRWWDNALAAAQAAADAPLLACTLTYLSSSAADRGDPTTAWQLANTALGHAGSNSRAKAWMAARAAQEAATMGERYAAQVALDLSLDLGVAFSATDVLADLVEQPWASGFDLACLYAMAAGTYGRLGELRQARDLVAEALKAMRPSEIGSAQGRGEAGGSAGTGAGNEVGAGGVGGGYGGGHGDKEFDGDMRPGSDLVGGGTEAHPAGAAESGGTTEGSAGRAEGRGAGTAGASGESGTAGPAGFSSPSGAAGIGGWAGATEADGLFGPNDQPNPLDLVGRAVPDQSSAQVKSRALALAEVAYAATRIGELDLAREAGRLAGDLAGRLEMSQAKRRLRALAPLLAETRKGR